MSVEVNKLTKIYGQQRAVNEISFTAEKGQILGFLGPNGAGKSTTMKMLTCFIEPSSGNATVCGHSILEDSLKVRQCIGYLPEHNPLYKGMYVKEFLNFVAGVYKVDKPAKRISDLIEMTGLGVEQHKLISSLSKGYRQRVGIAQALMHDPEVLILDEPTSGLDPNQLVDIRTLIKTIGEEKTVIFSTHIMQEVTALCDRVIIINKGDLVADDPIENLQSRVQNKHITQVSFEKAPSTELLMKVKGVEKVEKTDLLGQVNITSAEDIRRDIFQFAVKENLIILEMQKKTINIESVFQELTQTSSHV